MPVLGFVVAAGGYPLSLHLGTLSGQSHPMKKVVMFRQLLLVLTAFLLSVSGHVFAQRGWSGH